MSVHPDAQVEKKLSFDPPGAMVCLHTLCQFLLVADICFASSSIDARCEHCCAFLLFLIVPMNTLLLLHIWVPTGDPPSRVWVEVECLELYSPLQAVPICIALSIFPSEEGGRLLGCPRKRLYPAVYAGLLSAPCHTQFNFDRRLQSALA